MWKKCDIMKQKQNLYDNMKRDWLCVKRLNAYKLIGTEHEKAVQITYISFFA